MRIIHCGVLLAALLPSVGCTSAESGRKLRPHSETTVAAIEHTLSLLREGTVSAIEERLAANVGLVAGLPAQDGQRDDLMAASFLLLRTAGTTIEEAGVSRLWKRHKLSLLESLSIHDEVVLEDGSPLLREMKRMGRNDPECDVPEAQLRTFFADGLHMQCRADWLLELAETEDWQRFSDAYQSLHRAGADGIVFSAAQRAVWERKGPEFAATVAAFNTNREEVESLVRDGTASSTTSTTSTTSAILTDDLDSVITIFSDDPGIHISPAMMARLQALHAESLPESLWPVARRIAGSPPGDIRRQWFFFLAARGDKIRYAWRKPQLRTLFLQLWSEKMGPLERNTLWLAWDRLFRDAESSLGPPTDAALADRIRNAAAEARLVREVE